MLIYIIYDCCQKRLVNTCECALYAQSPTAVVRYINTTHLDINLSDVNHQWFLCCHTTVLFLHSPLLLLEYTYPHKSGLKIIGYSVPQSPLTLWNTEYMPKITFSQILNDISWPHHIGNIPKEWCCVAWHTSPKAILLSDATAPEYLAMWGHYQEVFGE